MTEHPHVIQHTTTWIGVALAGAGPALVQEQYPPPRPVVIVDEGYVGSSSCRSCHRGNHASWQASYHRSMTQIASASAILAPSDGVTPALEGTGWMPYLFSTLLMDPYDAVRWTASQSHRRNPGFASFRLDFTQHIEEQRNRVREEVLSEWLRTGLDAREDQRRAVLVRPDGTLDEERFRRIYAQRDRTPISLQE